MTSILRDLKAALFNLSTKQIELCEFDELDRESAKSLSAHWQKPNWWDETDAVERQNQPDYTWNWASFVSNRVLNRPSGKAVCVRSDDGIIQGAMIYELGVKSWLNPIEKTVFVELVATSPANRDILVREPRYRKAGLSLLRYAMIHSVEVGLRGRLSLFPIANQKFYTSVGFEETAQRSDELDVNLYELSTAAATMHLKQMGVLS